MNKKKKEGYTSFDLEETGRRLRSFRRAQDLTLAELAQQTGLSVGIISETESGRNKPSPTLMYNLHRLYGLNLHWLLTGQGKPVVKEKKQEPPKDENGEPTYDWDMLMWYADRLPYVKHTLLGSFVEFYYQHRDMIENMVSQKRKDVKTAA